MKKTIFLLSLFSFSLYGNSLKFIVTYPLKTIVGECKKYEFINLKIQKKDNQYFAENFEVWCDIFSMKTSDPNRDSNMYETLKYPENKKIKAIVHSAICQDKECKIHFDLEINNKKKNYQISSKFNSDSAIKTTGEFFIDLYDFNIEPPKLLFLQIDRLVKIQWDFSFDMNQFSGRNQ